MRRDIRELHGNRLQITFPDERWYARRICVGTPDECWDFVPSVSWVAGHYPKGKEFYKWLAGKGWSEAEEIKAIAGDKGTKVHQAINRLVCGGTVGMEDSFENPRTYQGEPLTPEEYFCVMTFHEWFEKTRPEVIDAEYVVWNERYGYAGTVDLKVRIDGVVWIIDIKTSKQIWPSMEIQIAAYKRADTSLPKNSRLAILQVGYTKNKIQKYKFTAIPDQFELFMAARKIWVRECEGQKPFQRDYPLSLSLSPELTLKEPVAA